MSTSWIGWVVDFCTTFSVEGNLVTVGEIIDLQCSGAGVISLVLLHWSIQLKDLPVKALLNDATVMAYINYHENPRSWALQEKVDLAFMFSCYFSSLGLLQSDRHCLHGICLVLSVFQDSSFEPIWDRSFDTEGCVSSCHYFGS